MSTVEIAWSSRSDKPWTSTKGTAFNRVHVARKCTAQRHELWAVQALQLGVGKLQRSERRRDVAGKLQLLAGEQQHLLDFGQRPLVARRRQLPVQCFERGLLSLRFGKATFEQSDLRLRVAEIVLRGLHRRTSRLDLGVLLRKTPRDFSAQLPIAVIGVDSDRGDR